ncbi:hypothetical protein CAPTEDRAFT_228955 [Capitella teleta]|uniref:Transmembrane protein 209 n=1 Tax=Capitella teleta TaxID=283909 RepID=R7THL4_CAPTE|nr:hypothetical protein CAPTEDRAFT_228955 [Capitella teleta]|eukprot:ELT90600.1 hypothetical protein CAPTEDRAFT_228955 [Capitella teleta]
MSLRDKQLKKYQYQVACRTPQSAKSTSKDDPDDSVTYGPDEWLRSTILLRVATEIETINKQLIRIGCEDMEIGVVSISTLKQLAVSKSLQLPSLNLLIPFLEASTNQEYLVHRVKELARGGCMSSFKWNGGGSFKGKDWEEHLPSDAYIVMHLLCSYLDSRLPPHPKFPDGRTFTAQHFMKTPDKPNASKKDYCCLYQSSTNPPHYKVLIADDVMNPRKGRNNMFHAILLFFYRVQLKEHGMLG